MASTAESGQDVSSTILYICARYKQKNDAAKDSRCTTRSYYRRRQLLQEGEGCGPRRTGAREWRNDPEKPLAARCRKLTFWTMESESGQTSGSGCATFSSTDRGRASKDERLSALIRLGPKGQEPGIVNVTRPEVSLQVRRIVEVGEASLECTLYGSGDPLILLANAGCSTSYFDHFGRQLTSAGLQIVAINMRGVGSSQGPLEGVTLHDLASDVAGVIEALDCAPAHVLGHAFGNRVARCLAADRPALVRSVIVLAAGGLIGPPHLWARPSVLPAPQR